MNKEEILKDLEVAWERLELIKEVYSKVPELGEIQVARLLSIHYGEGRKVTCAVLYDFKQDRFIYMIDSPSLETGLKVVQNNKLSLKELADEIADFSNQLNVVFPFVDWEENPKIEISVLADAEEE